MSLSVHRRLGDAGGGKGGSIVARGAAAHRHHAPAAASASASSSYSSSLEGADPALPSPSWQPLPRSLPKRRRDGTNNSAYDASGPAPRTRRTTARMTWPPERTPRRGGAALSSPQPRGLTREEEYLGWLGSLRSRPQPRGASASAPPSPTASSAARVPPPRHSGGINASSSSTDISPAALPSTRKGRPQASATSPVGSAPSPLSALATASLGAHRPPPMTKQLTGTRSASLRPKAKLPTRADSALPPLQTTKPTPDPPSMQTDLAPPPPFLAAFAHRIVEVLFNLNYGHRCAPIPQLNKPTTRACCDDSLLQANTVASTSGDPTLPPHLSAFSQRLIEILFNLNYGHLGYTGVVLMGVYAGLMELLSAWNPILKVSYVLLLILGAFGLGTGLMAATSIAPNGYTHRVSSVCSRLCTCLATFVFIVALACHMGSHGYIAGIVLGVVAVCYMLSVWIEGDPAAYGAYTWVWTAIKYLWQSFKWSGQREPLLP